MTSQPNDPPLSPWQRFIVKKIWGWIILGIAMIFNLMSIGFPLKGAFSFRSGVFLLIVVFFLLSTEMILAASNQESRANQVSGFTIALMFVTAFWWILFTPQVPPLF